MKKIIIAILALLPLAAMAQSNVWEIPDEDVKEQPKKVEKVKKEKEVKLQEDPKYLAGAVPEIDGHVVFTLDKDVPGLSADSIYNKVYRVFEEIVNEGKADDIQPASRIAAVNKGEHTIAARINEWLVFSNNFISLDRTKFTYTLIAQATDGHINVTMERISYNYEEGRSSGLKTSADDWITDKIAMNKKGTKLYKGSGKFRKKTIDRKDNIFGRIMAALTNQPYQPSETNKSNKE